MRCRPLAGSRAPTIAALLDADVEAPQPWLASAYVAGPTLAEHVAAHGALGDVALRALGAALAEALVAIHAAGVVHRDLTPRNVVLGPDGPRVVDFGIAWYDGAAAITETGVRVGTPAWMAPERLTHDEVTASGDVWSWGAVMAYAALGHPAVGGAGPEVVATRILRGEVDLDGVPSWLAPWVGAALSVAPGERPTPDHLVAAMAGAVAPPSAGTVAGSAGLPPTAPAPGLPPTAPAHAGLPPTEMSPGQATVDALGETVPDPLAAPGAPVPPAPAPPSASGSAGSAGGSPTPPDRTRLHRPEPIDRDAPRWSPTLVRAVSAVAVLAAAVAVGLWASLLVVVIVCALAMVLAVVLRLSRLRLPDGARPVPPTWSVALGGLVALGTGLGVALGPVGGAVALVVLIVLFVVIGGDIG